MPKKEFIGIDLFSGAGGMSLGAIQAGVDVRLAVDIDPHAIATYKYNHPQTEVISDDIRNIKNINLKTKGKIKILFGGPPCQGFSTSNQRNRTFDNPKNWLFLEFIRIAELWKPDWIVIENVKGLADTKSGYFFQEIVLKLEDLHYTTTSWILNSADYGVPQKRNRLFIIGSLAGIKLDKPASVGRHITVREAISDLPELSNGADTYSLPYKTLRASKYVKMMRGDGRISSNHLVTRNNPMTVERYKYIPQGGNWKDIPAELMKNYKDRERCHTGIYHRLCYDEPSVVIGNFRKNMLIHPEQDRGLSVREAARLQSFPDWYEFKGSIGYQQQQVGNAVPPLLSNVVFKKILQLS